MKSYFLVERWDDPIVVQSGRVNETNGVCFSEDPATSVFTNEKESWLRVNVTRLELNGRRLRISSKFIVKKKKRKKWSHKTINTYKVKDGQSETTRGIECHYTLQRSIHCNHCCFVAANASLKSVNRDGKTLNNSHSLTLSACFRVHRSGFRVPLWS